MNLYFAPLEGITTYIYRNTHSKMFGGCDAYYAPFVSPSENEKVSIKGMKDIHPERNDVIPKIQVLTNHADGFLKFAEKVKEAGYDEINLNFGCPAGTVVKKGRGSGFLRDTEVLDRFLDEVFNKSDIKISVKTRIGFSSSDEMDKLMEIYNKYPLSQLIIHPRTREEFYKGEPNMPAFEKAYKSAKAEVCYNGNVFTVDDYNQIAASFPDLEGIMIGRGAIMNPAIFREIKGGERLTTAELIKFSEKLIENYYEILQSDTFTLHKLKEIWMYIMQNFPDEKKVLKAIKKSNKLRDFVNAIKFLPEIK